MFKWFRRAYDNKAMANNAEQELSTIRKLAMVDRAKRILSEIHTERRMGRTPVKLERRKK